MTYSPGRSKLSFNGHTIKIDYISESPEETWKYISNTLPETRAQLRPDMARDECPVILVYGASGSGKTTTLFGHPDYNPTGYVARMAKESKSQNVQVRVLEYTKDGYRDLVARMLISKTPFTQASPGPLGFFKTYQKTWFPNLNRVLENRSKEVTANNESSSRGFVCIAMEIGSCQKKCILVDMPGTENLTTLGPDYTSNEQSKQLRGQSQFIKRVLQQFTFGLAKNNVGGFSASPFWKIVVEHATSMYIIGCAKSRLSADVKEVAYFFHNIGTRGNRNIQWGSTRKPLSPVSMNCRQIPNSSAGAHGNAVSKRDQVNPWSRTNPTTEVLQRQIADQQMQLAEAHREIERMRAELAQRKKLGADENGNNLLGHDHHEPAANPVIEEQQQIPAEERRLDEEILAEEGDADADEGDSDAEDGGSDIDDSDPDAEENDELRAEKIVKRMGRALGIPDLALTSGAVWEVTNRDNYLNIPWDRRLRRLGTSRNYCCLICGDGKTRQRPVAVAHAYTHDTKENRYKCRAEGCMTTRTTPGNIETHYKMKHANSQ